MKLMETLCPWLIVPLGVLEGAAARNRLGHGWLISGPQDVGKRNLAYLFAARLLAGKCNGNPPRLASPVDALSAYIALAEARDLHPDLHRVRPEEEKRSISVEQIREMSASLALTPHGAGCKIVIVESAESMTPGAANALLKSLEEPTASTYLLLLTDRPGRLPATIRSRCQQLHLAPPALDETLNWLGSASKNSLALLPNRILQRSPLAAARALVDPDNFNEYSMIFNEINLLYKGKADPHTVAEAWYKRGAELPLTCLIESLQLRIRQRLVPDRSNPITDSGLDFPDNTRDRTATDSLFEGLKLADSLREQIGRGINVELALRALLVGLDPAASSRTV